MSINGNEENLFDEFEDIENDINDEIAEVAGRRIGRRFKSYAERKKGGGKKGIRKKRKRGGEKEKFSVKFRDGRGHEACGA